MTETTPVSYPQGNFSPKTPPSDPDLNHAWQIENLIKTAFRRTQERFLSYFLALVLSFVLGMVFVLVLFLGGFFLGLLGGLLKIYLLSSVLAVVFLISALLVVVYLGTWINLTLVDVVIRPGKVGVMETFGQLRSKVWGFYFYTLFFSLFIFGLLPWGVLSLGVVLILWSFWASFSTFVYLEKGKKHLANLWYSRALINERFWGIAGRLVLVYAAFYLLFFLLTISRSGLLTALGTILSWAAGVFFLSFAYEIYRLLPEPSTEPRASLSWLILSVLGWLLMLIGLTFAATQLPNLIRNIPWDQIRRGYSQAQSERRSNPRFPGRWGTPSSSLPSTDNQPPLQTN